MAGDTFFVEQQAKPCPDQWLDEKCNIAHLSLKSQTIFCGEFCGGWRIYFSQHTKFFFHIFLHPGSWRAFFLGREGKYAGKFGKNVD